MPTMRQPNPRRLDMKCPFCGSTDIEKPSYKTCWGYHCRTCVRTFQRFDDVADQARDEKLLSDPFDPLGLEEHIPGLWPD